MKRRDLIRIVIVSIAGVALLSLGLIKKEPKEEIANKYFTALVNRDSEGMIKYSHDIRYNNVKERKEELEDIIKSNSKIVEYKLLKNKEEKNNRVTVAFKDESGYIQEMQFEVKRGKVEIGHDSYIRNRVIYVDDLGEVGKVISQEKYKELKES